VTNQSELNLRAALCRQLAKREPANRALWMAEAENWVCLSDQKLRGEAMAFRHRGIFAQSQLYFLKAFGS
jgi:hypothetical protein